MLVQSFDYSQKEAISHAFKIRRKVFVEEQKVKEAEEFDHFDDGSFHYLVYSGDCAVGTARWRITAAGVKLERFSVLREYRNSGFGKALIEKMMSDLSFSQRCYLHSQTHVVPFYEKFGFKTSGPVFSECNIDHYKMTFSKGEYGLSFTEVMDCVRVFHEAFNLQVNADPTAEIDKGLLNLRFKLMKEENEEYLQAARAGDLVEVADALGDQLYILCGTILTHGLQFKIEEVYREIQRSNMSKLDENGKPIYREDGKVLKSDLYFKPDIAAILGR